MIKLRRDVCEKKTKLGCCWASNSNQTSKLPSMRVTALKDKRPEFFELGVSRETIKRRLNLRVGLINCGVTS